MTGENNPGDGRGAERAARLGYGRLLAYLAVGSRDVEAAEGARGDALRAAVEAGPHGPLVLAPSVGARIWRAAALSHIAGALAALECSTAPLLPISPTGRCAHLLCLEGADEEAIDAYRQAVGLSESPAAPDFLAREAAAVKE